MININRKEELVWIQQLEGHIIIQYRIIHSNMLQKFGADCSVNVAGTTLPPPLTQIFCV